MSDPLTLTAHDVAKLLRWEIGTFYRHVTRLKRSHGFPAPLPGSRTYAREQVVAWINRNGTPATPPPPASPGLDAEVASCEAQLLARARDLVAG